MIVLRDLPIKEIVDLVRLGDELLCINFDCAYTTVGKSYEVAKYIDSENQVRIAFPKDGVIGYKILDDENDPEGLLEVEIREIMYSHLYYPVSLISEEDKFAIALGVDVTFASDGN